jgi:uncharacterized membrane protein YphA (DoxX/SURF4 family)
MNLNEQTTWTRNKKYLFLVIFIYFILYSFPFPIDAFVSIIQRFMNWMAELSGLKGLTTFTNGSGDTTYNWLLIPVKLFFAFLFAFPFMYFKKEDQTYTRLNELLILLIRYFLIYMMLRYGFGKVIQAQFPYPRLSRLMQPFGESSPMGLAWTFIGSSKGYNIFTGSCEVVAAFLLLFRRTKTFGALFAMTVCFTIFVMNLCYDIPVKLLSFHLFVYATFVACDDYKRLIGFFFTNQKVEPYQMKSYFAGHKRYKYIVAFKYFFLIFVMYKNFKTVYDRDNANIKERKFALYGIHNIAYKTVNNDTIPLLYKSEHWKNLIVNADTRAFVHLLNDSTVRYTFKIDSLKHKINFTSAPDTLQKYSFAYTYKNKKLRLEGKMKNDNIVMVFNRKDESKFLLNSRGFHWINEEPFNR